MVKFQHMFLIMGIAPDFETEKEQYKSFYGEIIDQKDKLFKELLDIRNENESLDRTIKTQHKHHKSKMTESEEFYEKKLAVKSAVLGFTT